MPGLQPLKSSKHKNFFEGFQLSQETTFAPTSSLFALPHSSYIIAVPMGSAMAWSLPSKSNGQRWAEPLRDRACCATGKGRFGDGSQVTRSYDDGNIKTLEKNLPTISLHLYTFLHRFTRNCNWPLQNGTYVFFLPVFYFWYFLSIYELIWLHSEIHGSSIHFFSHINLYFPLATLQGSLSKNHWQKHLRCLPARIDALLPQEPTCEQMILGSNLWK